MGKKLDLMLILFKEQTTAGVDAAPTAADAMLVRNPSITPIASDIQETGLVKPYFGASDGVVTEKRLEVSFEVLLGGSGAAGTAPAFGRLLKAAGMSETVTATHVDYVPISTGFKLFTLYAFLDGVKHKSIDLMARVSMQFNPKNFPFLRFSFVGLWQPLTDEVAPAGVSYASFEQPEAVLFGKTTLSYFGQNPCVESLEFDFNNQVTLSNRINCSMNEFTGRSIEGSMSTEMESVSTFDWVGKQAAAEKGVFELIHGTTAGNIIEIKSDFMQTLPSGAYGDANRTALLGHRLKAIPDGSGLEFRMRFK